GAVGLVPVGGQRAEEALGHLAASRVVRAEEQDARLGHGRPPSGQSSSRSTMTQSRHSPPSLPWRWYTPTTRNPQRSCSRRLAVFSGKIRDTIFQKPRSAYARHSASSTMGPAPFPRADRLTQTESSATPAHARGES